MFVFYVFFMLVFLRGCVRVCMNVYSVHALCLDLCALACVYVFGYVFVLVCVRARV